MKFAGCWLLLSLLVWLAGCCFLPSHLPYSRYLRTNSVAFFSDEDTATMLQWSVPPQLTTYMNYMNLHGSARTMAQVVPLHVEAGYQQRPSHNSSEPSTAVASFGICRNGRVRATNSTHVYATIRFPAPV